MFSYTPLFTLLVQKGMTKTQLREAVGIGTGTLLFPPFLCTKKASGYIFSKCFVFVCYLIFQIEPIFHF